MSIAQDRRPSPMSSTNPTPVDAFSSNNPFRQRAINPRAPSPVKSSAMAAPAPPASLPLQKTPIKSPASVKSPGSGTNPFADPKSPFSSPPAVKTDSTRPSNELTKGMAGLSVRAIDGPTIPPLDPDRVRPSSSPEKRERPLRDIAGRPSDRPPSRDKIGDRASPDKRRPHKSSRERSRTEKSRKGPSTDLIDSLDQTWTGAAGIHHGGPFDSCMIKPRRGKPLPIDAFAPNSKNMTMTGGAVNAKTAKDEQFATLHMNTDEGYGDFNSATSAYTKKNEYATMDAYARVEPIIGSETAGLGTSTFLDGTPAPRREIERRESEAGQENIGVGSGTGGLSGIARRPSVLKVLGRNRGMSQPRVPGVMDQDGDRDRRYPPPSMAQSAEGLYRATTGQEKYNPFFTSPTSMNMENAVDDSVPRDQNHGPSMMAPLTRRVTESNSGEQAGFLRRFRSRREPKATRPSVPPPPPAMV